jgi:hypothetical protein
VVELFIFGPPLVLGTIIALLGRRYIVRAGLTRRAAWLTAGLAGLAGAAAFFAFAVEWLLYAVGENEGEYYDFSTYMEYRNALDSWLGVVAAVGYGLLAAGLALAAGIVWRRVHPSAGVALAAAACVAVVLPWEVPSRLDRVEYGKDPVLYTRPQTGGAVEQVRGRPAVCIEYGVEGVFSPGTASPVPPDERLCIPVQESAIRRAPGRRPHVDVLGLHRLVEELNDSGIEPREKPTGAEVDGFELDKARWVDP